MLTLIMLKAEQTLLSPFSRRVRINLKKKKTSIMKISAFQPERWAWFWYIYIIFSLLK